MRKQLRHFFSFTSVCLLLTLTACTPDRKTPLSTRQELAQLQRDYLVLQKEHRDLQIRMTLISKAHENIKLRLASGANHNNDLEEQLIQTQKKLSSQQSEYQSLLADYAALESTIAPIASRLAASIAAHRKELIGTKLGTVVLKNNRQLRQAEVMEITDNALRLKSKDGWTWVNYTDLPPPIKQRFFYDLLLVSPKALITETPDTEITTTPPNQNEQAQALLEAAFAEAHRRELAQLQISMQNKIPVLEKKIVTAKQQIKNLKVTRRDTSRIFSRRTGGIRRSSVDRDKALNKIDMEIRKLESAIQTANIQIKSWKQELIPNKNDEK